MIAGLLPGSPLLAQQYEKSRKLTKVYPATTETTVQILNKYGNIHILPWDEDSIRFEISIKVEANKQSKVEKTYDNIEIEFVTPLPGAFTRPIASKYLGEIVDRKNIKIVPDFNI